MGFPATMQCDIHTNSNCCSWKPQSPKRLITCRASRRKHLLELFLFRSKSQLPEWGLPSLAASEGLRNLCWRSKCFKFLLLRCHTVMRCVDVRSSHHLSLSWGAMKLNMDDGFDLTYHKQLSQQDNLKMAFSKARILIMFFLMPLITYLQKELFKNLLNEWFSTCLTAGDGNLKGEGFICSRAHWSVFFSVPSLQNQESLTLINWLALETQRERQRPYSHLPLGAETQRDGGVRALLEYLFQHRGHAVTLC